MSVSLANLVAQVLADNEDSRRRRGDGTAKCPICRTGERTRNKRTGEAYAYCAECLKIKNKEYSQRRNEAKTISKDNS